MPLLGLTLLSAVRAQDPTFLAPLPMTGAVASRRSGELIVSFRPTAREREIEDGMRAVGGVHARGSISGSHYLLTLSEGVSTDRAIAYLRSLPQVAYAEPNGILHGAFRPNDDLYPFQWHLPMIGAEQAWDIRTCDPSIVVAVLDSGIAYEDFGAFRRAPDWRGTVFVPGYDTFTGSGHANDDLWHGTMVASVIAEGTDNRKGAAGFGFGCALMPVKVLDRNDNAPWFNLAEGINFAVRSLRESRVPVRVINLSLGGPPESVSETVRRAIDSAVAAGIVVVASAGNENSPQVSFPALLPNVIAVGALNARKRKASYSSFGEALDVVAPGGDVARDHNGDDWPDGILQQGMDWELARTGRYDRFAYYWGEGTSFAAPQVAALAALLVQQGIDDPAAVKSAIESTAEDLGAPGFDNIYGHGLIRPWVALSAHGLGR